MPSISVSDLADLSLSFPPDGRSGFFRYLRSPDTLQIELDHKQVPDGGLSEFLPSGISFKDPVSLGAKSGILTIQAGLEGNLGIQQGTLFDPKTDDYGDSVAIPAGQAYVSACLQASLGASPVVPAADLQFGFDAGTDLTLTNYRLFDTSTKVASAIQTVFQQYIIPRDLADLEEMAPDSVVTLEGTGSLKFFATANLLAVTNPLASLPVLSFASLDITQGGKVSVGAAVALRGGYQIRVRRLAGKKVQLGFEKKRGEEWSVDVSAEAQLTGGVGTLDLIPTLLKAVSKDAVIDAASWGAQTGLTASENATLAAAVKAGIDRTLALCLSGQLESSAGSAAAFSYEIDLGALDAEGQAAVLAALRGELEGLEAAGLAGVVRLRSAFDSLREAKHLLKVNLLGIYNFEHLTDLLRNGKLIVDQETGSITVADQATANRIGFTSDNFAKDGSKLRTVLASSVTLTAGYSVAGVLTPLPAFTCSCCSFESHQGTTRQDLQRYIQAGQALDLFSAEVAQDKLDSVRQEPDRNLGPSTFHVESTYAAAAFRGMFLDPAGRARAQQDYESLGRGALASLLLPGDPVNQARRRALEDPQLWAAMRVAGSAENLEQAVKDVGIDAAVAPVIRGDCDLILWWAGAMSGMAQAINALAKYLAGLPAPNPEDPTLRKLRRSLDDAMSAVCRDVEPRFGEPWGLLVMAQASGMQDATTARLVSSRLTFVATRPQESAQGTQTGLAKQAGVAEA